MDDNDIILTVDGLETQFRLDEGVVRAVAGASLSIKRGTTVCVVGESGCGKSITARSILGLVEPPGVVAGGHIWWKAPARDDASSQVTRRRLQRGRRRTPRQSNGAANSTGPGDSLVDLAQLDPHSETIRRIRGNDISMVFQEPMASLSPMYTIGDQLREAIRLHLDVDQRQAHERSIGLLSRVGIPRPQDTMRAYSFQLSGGMCQRVMIAMALSCDPALLIADEPTTALDVTTQARIIDLFREVQQGTGMALMFITHDLGVVAEIADEVVVMYLGTVVERGAVDEIFHDPKHPYTKALLASMPRIDAPRGTRVEPIPGHVPAPLDRPTGCPFHPRCASAIPGLCDTMDPPDVTIGDGRTARCVLYEPKLLDASHDLTEAATTKRASQ